MPSITSRAGAAMDTPRRFSVESPALGTEGEANERNDVGESATLPASNSDTVESTSTPRPVTGRPGDYATFLPVDQAHYILDREIARGGMGRIRVARDRRLRRDVAVKEILHADSATALRFEREVRITARLQHPSIVSVHEAGRWPSGEPFYAMKLVTGRSLDEVISSAKSLEERLALLPNVLAIADAIAYAHGERVIHRDLKPKNVLVGAFGETVVIDWGLAKDLADTSIESVDSGGHTSSGSETEVGEVIGTPAYMPPEQAEGKPVDERADVYSIGAILDHLLSGRPPYTGSNSLAIIIAVREGPPVPLAKRQPGVPPDLLAIVERAMARDISARYPSARELAEDLRRYQTGQLVGAHRYSLGQLLRRWMRKYRTALSVAGVALVVLVVVAIVAVQRIVHSQRLELESRHDAETLMDFMLVDLREKLEPIGKLDILEEAARKSVAYYDRRIEADPRKRAIAHINLGDVLAKSQSDGALAQYREAFAIFETLGARDPAGWRAQWDRARIRHLVGDALLARGDAAGALEQYQSSLAIQEAVDTHDPRLLGVTRQRIGDVHFSLGEHSAALDDFRASLVIFEGLVAKSPDRIDAQRDVSVSRNKLADVLVARGESDAAIAELRSSLAIVTRIRDQDPSNAGAQRDLAVGHTKLGDHLAARGDLTSALEEYRAGLEIDQALAVQDPTNADRKRDVAISLDQIGIALAASGDSVGALVNYRASMAIREVLARQASTNIDRKRELAISHQHVGEVLERQGDTDGALAEYRASLALREVVAMQPSTERADRQREVAASRDRIGEVLRTRGDKTGALQEFRSALALREGIVATDPTNQRRQRDLSLSHDRVGDMALAQGDTSAALASYRASLAIREALAASDPNSANRQRDVSFSHSSRGNVLFTLDDKLAALSHIRKSLAIFEGLAATDPANVDWKRSVAVMQNKVGDVLLATGDTADALAQYRASLALVEVLRAKDPTNTDWQADAATGFEKVGDALFARGDKASARAQYRLGLAIADKLHAKDGKNVDWKTQVEMLRVKVTKR